MAKIVGQVKDYSALYHDTYKGTTKAQLRKEYAQLIKVANERIKAGNKPTKRGINYAEHAQAYKHIVEPFKGTKFLKQKDGNLIFKMPSADASYDELVQAHNLVQRYMQSKTSTKAGIKELIETRRKTAKEAIDAAIETGKFKAFNKKDRTKAEDALLRYMGTEEWQSLKEKYNYDSSVMKEAAAVVMSREHITDLDKLINAFAVEIEQNSVLAEIIRKAEMAGQKKFKF